MKSAFVFVSALLFVSSSAFADGPGDDGIQRQILASIQKLDADVQKLDADLAAKKQPTIHFFAVGSNVGNQPQRLNEICTGLGGKYFSYFAPSGDSVGGLREAQLGCKFN